MCATPSNTWHLTACEAVAPCHAFYSLIVAAAADLHSSGASHPAFDKTFFIHPTHLLASTFLIHKHNIFPSLVPVSPRLGCIYHHKPSLQRGAILCDRVHHNIELMRAI